jgi:hypothetical protein
MVALKLGLAIIVVSLCIASAAALTDGEINGLNALMASLPGLSSPFGIMHWHASDIHNACNWTGIQCVDNSITGLYVRENSNFPISGPRGPDSAEEGKKDSVPGSLGFPPSPRIL